MDRSLESGNLPLARWHKASLSPTRIHVSAPKDNYNCSLPLAKDVFYLEAKQVKRRQIFADGSTSSYSKNREHPSPCLWNSRPDKNGFVQQQQRPQKSISGAFSGNLHRGHIFTKSLISTAVHLCLILTLKLKAREQSPFWFDELFIVRICI